MAIAHQVPPRELSLPADLRQEIDTRASALRLSFEQTIVLLLRLGLVEQTRRESEVDKLLDDLQNATPSEFQKAADRLGEAVFGK